METDPTFHGPVSSDEMDYASDGEDTSTARPLTPHKSAHFLLWDQGLGCLSKQLSQNRLSSSSKSSRASPRLMESRSPRSHSESSSPLASSSHGPAAPLQTQPQHVYGSMLQHQLLRYPPALMGGPQIVSSSHMTASPVSPFAMFAAPNSPVSAGFFFNPNMASLHSPRTAREAWTPSAQPHSPMSSHPATPLGRDRNAPTPISMTSNNNSPTHMSPIESAIVLSATPIPAAKVLHGLSSSSSPVSSNRWAVVLSPLNNPLPPAHRHSASSPTHALTPLPVPAIPEGSSPSQLRLSRPFRQSKDARFADLPEPSATVSSSSSSASPRAEGATSSQSKRAPPSPSPSGSSDGAESDIGEDSGDTPRSKSGKPQYFCDYPGCTRKEPLSNRYTLKRHIRIMHSPNPRPRNFQCDFAGCSSRFADKDKLMRHMLCHDQSPNNKFYCTHCNRPFTDKSNRNRHQDRCSARRGKASDK